MADDSLIGKRLDEYLLQELLGQGGMARVYRGLDVRLKRYVAVKVIDTPFRHDAAYKERFQREAQAIAQLSGHPNIVSLYRYGDDDGLLYMAMQYVTGSDLETVLASYEASGEFMGPEEVSELMYDLGAALDYAHARGVIHRDVKPSNIMINTDGRAILTDFGLALLSEVGTMGEVFGTPHYIAPEQAISSAGAGPRSDLYALGVILYRIFTGRLPFSGDDPRDVAMKQMTETPPAPRQIRPDLSPAVDAVIRKAMAKEPEDRYSSGTALADALDGALAQMKLAPTQPAATSPSMLERVVLHQAELPPLPPAVTPQQSPAEPPPTGPLRLPPPTTTPDRAATAPLTPQRRRLAFLPPAALAVAACILLACVAAGLLWFNRTLAPGVIGEMTATASLPPPPATATATEAAKATRAATATQPATATATPAIILTAPPLPPRSELLFNRAGRTLFITNVGQLPVRLAGLTLVMEGGGNDTFDDWPVELLQSGRCLLLRRNDNEQPRELPAACDGPAAEVITFRWRDDFGVRYQGEVAGSCRLKQDDDACAITLGEP